MGVVLWFSHVHRIVFFGFFRNRNIVYVSSTLSGTTAKIEEGGTPQASRLRSRLLPCGALDRLDRPEDLETHSLFNPARSKHFSSWRSQQPGTGKRALALAKNALVRHTPNQRRSRRSSSTKISSDTSVEFVSNNQTNPTSHQNPNLSCDAGGVGRCWDMG